MSAELVDPFTTREPNLTREEWEDIREEMWDGHWDDHALFVECLKEAMKALRDIACGVGQPYEPSRAATQCLRAMAYRAKTGVPFGEPVEPAWSMDSERRLPR